MSDVIVDKKVPAFSLPSTAGKDFKLSQFKGQKVVLYFYPRDNTPGCSQEGIDFNSALSQFKRANTVVVGVSRDSLKKHDNFRSKYDYQFDLLADEDEAVCQLFGVMKDKNMYGKKVRGIERSTFLIDEKGYLRAQWRKVKIPGHVDEVLAAAKALPTHKDE